jgi:hypothetical protein
MRAPTRNVWLGLLLMKSTVLASITGTLQLYDIQLKTCWWLFTYFY